MRLAEIKYRYPKLVTTLSSLQFSRNPWPITLPKRGTDFFFLVDNGILPHALDPYLGFYQTSKPFGKDITSELMDFKTSDEATSFKIH